MLACDLWQDGYSIAQDGLMLIKTKLAPPHQAINTLWRDALVDRIVAQPRPLTLVNAPAGFGKTTLLGQCYKRWRREGLIAAWYSVDDRRFESEQVFAYLMYALHQAGLSLPYSGDAIEAGLPGLATRNAANALLLALEASEEPVRLIIDDYHRIASPTLDAFIAYVINRLPAHTSLVIATRGETGLPVSSLRAMGNVLCLDQSDLRFSVEEARHLFAEAVVANRCDAFETLVARTEGWPAVLQLLSLWLNGRPPGDDLSGLTRRSADLADYLAEQVFSGLPHDLQEFLLLTSCAGQICGDLADALTGGSDGHAQLDRLARMNLLVAPVDDLHIWYRYHPLLAEFLQDWLARHSHHKVELLHERAARWFARADMLANALDHAGFLTDPQATLVLLEEAGGWQVGLRGGTAMLRHTEHVVLTDPERFPRVWLAQVYLAGQEGRISEARALMDRLQLCLRQHPEMEARDPALAIEVLANEIVTRIYEDRPIPADTLQLIQEKLQPQAIEAIPAALLNHLLCLAAYETGDHARCQSFGEEALKRARANRLNFAESYVHQYLGLSRMAQGRRREAEISFRRARDHARRHFGEASVQVETASILLARALYLDGKAGSAQDLIQNALPGVEGGEGWLEIFAAAYETQAWLHANAAGLPRAEQLIQRALRTARDRNLPRLAFLAGLWQVRLQLHAGQTGRAAELFAQVEPPSPAMTARSPAIGFAWRVAEAALRLAQGEQSGEIMATVDALADEAFSQGIVSHEVEAGLLKAVALVSAGRARPSVHAFQAALARAEEEGLSALISQFGALLAPLLAACQDDFHLLDPEQRATVTRLLSTLAQRGKVLRSLPAANDVVVTPRELDVLKALADGLSSKEIARRLGVAESTVKTHRINVYRKLNVAVRSKAIEAARNLGLL